MAVFAIWIEPVLAKIFLWRELVTLECSMCLKVEESGLRCVSHVDLTEFKAVLDVEEDCSSSLFVDFKFHLEGNLHVVICFDFDLAIRDWDLSGSWLSWYVVLFIIVNVEHIEESFLLY